MIAIPSDPPTWRMLLITAEPTPALSTGRISEERQVEHRDPLTKLEEDEHRERRDRDRDQRQHARRPPAVVVRLDQPVREREQADCRGDQAGEVEALFT